jgi:flagellar motor switch protein FliG
MEFTGAQKVAAFLLSLDTQTASTVLSRFNENEVNAVTHEMLNMRSVERDQIREVHEQFMELAENGDDFIPDARSVAEQLINSAVGEERGKEMIDDPARSAPRRQPFESLLAAEPRQIADALKAEHPQTIAQVLSHLQPQQAGQVLSRLPEEVHSDVVLRMTNLNNPPNELLDRLDRVLHSKIQTDPQSPGVSEEARNKMVAEILNMVGKDVRKKAIEEMEQEAPEKAKEIEGLMFVFDDFQSIGDNSIRKIVMEVDNDTLALALKTAGEELRNKFLSNLSKRARAMVDETLENLGPKPLSEVEEAQREIMSTARSLDEQGEIALRRGEEEQMV